MEAQSFGPRYLRLASILVAAGSLFGQARPEQHRGPYLNLSEGRTVATRYHGSLSVSQARALSTATGDFDEDGMPDLVAGFATADGAGAVTVHRGNVDALWPYGALRGTEPPALLPDARVFGLPEAPDFLAAGDFDADGHWDIAAGHSGSSSLYFLKGDGHGGFAEARRIALPGSVTAMTSGDINRADGLTDLMVAVTGGAGPRVLVFESPDGALRGKPEVFTLPAEARALAVMPLDGGLKNGLAVAAGHDLLLIHGRDRRLTRSQSDRDGVAPATVTRQTFPFALQSLAVGRFTSPTLDLATIGDDGQVHILERSDAYQPVGIGRTLLSLAPSGLGLGEMHSRAFAPTRAPAVRAPACCSGPVSKTTSMILRTAIGLPLSARQSDGSGARLVTARVAATGRDSLVIIDPAARQLHIVSHRSRSDAASMAVTASLPVAGAPTAVQPMRINKDALQDLVVLTDSQTEPIVHTTAADHVYVVTTTSDDLYTNVSLRQAITSANQEVGSTVEIDFNIPVTDPNRDPTTGVFTIQPIFQNTLEALPNLESMTIDGYTQPGASPNTLTTGDNAHPLIEINGSMAGAGPSGLYLGGAGTVIRGLVMTNFLAVPDPDNSNYVSGGQAMDIESDSNFVEGNFVGIDAGGSFAQPNSAGLTTMSDDYIGNGSTIGGTTPQARNIVSGNDYGGIYYSQFSTPNTFFIQGNYIGTDGTGTQTVPNSYAGVVIYGINGVVGGTAAGAGNLISGNISFNVIAEIGGGGGNTFQGNLIGTDVTGTHALLSGAGVGLAGSDGDTIGGTTPAARNILSGNLFGVTLLAGNQNDLIEGNYIGLDVTGSQAVPNRDGGVDFGTDYTDTFGGFHVGTPVFTSTIGGEAAGAANVISGNGGPGITIISKSGSTQSNVISGNLIGTDASGLKPLGNTGDGVLIETYAAGNSVGGTDPEAVNVIAYNTTDGVHIDPGAPTATTFGVSSDSVIGNAIYSNGGTGVRIPSGTGNTVSRNLIYLNGALGIDIDAAGVLVNSACQSNTAGANLLQNAPVLTAGAGSAFVSATATGPNGNTSEFSNCVATSLSGNVLNIAGTFNSLPSTAYTIEYFSNASCDPSGYGQGRVYLGSVPVTTNSSCTAPLSNSLNLTNADLGVTNTSAYIGGVVYELFPVTSVVSNNGPIAAAAVTWTDVLPAGVNYLSATTTQGSCGFASGTVTCNLGTLPAGGKVTISLSIVFTGTGTVSNTVSVASPTPDANTANNSATLTTSAVYNPYLNSLSPASVFAGSPALALTLVGEGFSPTSQVTFGGVTYPATFNPSWTATGCGGTIVYCTALTITIPAAQLTTVATVQVSVVTTGIGAGSQTLPFYINPPTVVPGPVAQFILSGIGTTYAAGSLAILTVTAADANGLTVPTFTGTVNLTTTDPAPGVFTAGGGAATLTFAAANDGQQSTIVELQTFGTQSITATDVSNPAIAGTVSGIVVSNGPASNLALTGSPQATLPGQAFALPLSVTVTDESGNLVPNQTVTFNAPATGASAVLSSTTATTNSLGVASVTATANAISGAYEVGVTFGAALAGGGANADVFLLTNGTGLATLTATAGTPQSAFTGQLFSTNLQATLLDGLGHPISGATVYFTAGDVNGATALVTFAPTTNASGVATSIANAPINASSGAFPVTASAGGLTATFTLTDVGPQPVVMTITGGSPQSTAIGTAFSVPLTVHVTDGSGIPRAGVVVTYIPPLFGAGATLSAGRASTDSSGNASLTATANSTPGTYNVAASVGGVTVNFALTNSPVGTGSPASIAATAGTPQSQFVHAAFATAFQVLVKDANGNPLSGASVTFSAPASGASGTFGSSATVATNGSGLATAPAFTANTVAGTYFVTAKAGTVSTAFSVTNLAGSPVNMNIYAGNNQTATINTTFGTALAVQLVDTYGNPVAANQATVTFIPIAGTSGASGTFSATASVTNGNNGLAIAPSLLANGTAGAWNVLVIWGSQFLQFNLTNSTMLQNRCDVNQDGIVNVLDAQSMIDQSLGLGFPANDLNGDNVVNVVDLQIVIDAALNLGCSAH